MHKYLCMHFLIYCRDLLWGYLGVCAEVSSSVDLYEDLEVYDGRKVGFCVVCLGVCMIDQRKMWLFIIH